MKKQFDLDGINENAEEKAARAKSVGTHLHLTIFMFEDDFPNKVVKYEKKLSKIKYGIR